MISVTSITNNYILQPTLLNKHKETLEWLSAAALWKRELTFFQKLLDQKAPLFSTVADKKEIDHFQNFVIYYKNELLDTLMAKLRIHEKNLSDMLESKDETKINYFKEHDTLMGELEATQKVFMQNKEALFSFIEKVM